MYVDSSSITVNHKTYTRHLLRTSFRKDAFRTSKTGHLEMRPLFLRREARTRGHAFVVELAYRMIQTLSKQWRQLDLTVQQRRVSRTVRSNASAVSSASRTEWYW